MARLASWIAAAVVLAMLAPVVIVTALSDHADAAEMRQIFESARGRLFLLGLLTGALCFIAPIVSALAFIHLCLAELENARAGASRT